MEHTPTILMRKKHPSTYSSDALSLLSQQSSSTYNNMSSLAGSMAESRLRLLSDFEQLFPDDFCKRLESMEPELVNIFARELHSVRNLRNVEKNKMDSDPVKLQKFQLAQDIARLDSCKLRLAKANEKLLSDIRRIRRITDINKAVPGSSVGNGGNPLTSSSSSATLTAAKLSPVHRRRTLKSPKPLRHPSIFK